MYLDPESSQDYPGKAMLSAGQVNAELTWMCLSFRVRTSYFQFLSSFLLPPAILEKSSTVRVWVM